MEITVNGQSMALETQIPVTKLLEVLGYQNGFVAVAINQQCVPRSHYDQQTVQSGDRIEILAPMAGG